MDPLARTLIVVGLVLAGLGVLLAVGPSIPLLGKLPGDIRVEHPGFRFYFPLTSSLLVSAVITAVLWLFARLR